MNQRFLLFFCWLVLGPVLAHGDFIEFERDRYSRMAESVPEFSVVVGFLDAMRKGDRSAKITDDGLEEYRNSYAYFVGGDLALLGRQTVSRPFSRMWLYPYQDLDQKCTYLAVVASMHYLLKCTDAINNNEIVSDEEVSMLLQEAGNSLFFVWSNLCSMDVGAQVMFQFVASDFYQAFRRYMDEASTNSMYAYFIQRSDIEKIHRENYRVNCDHLLFLAENPSIEDITSKILHTFATIGYSEINRSDVFVKVQDMVLSER